jgi:threonine dehydrogenase-like Zn-dependent dehydrogenase
MIFIKENQTKIKITNKKVKTGGTMYKQLLLNAKCVPHLSDYELKPLQSGEVRVKSQFGSPKHGTEVTFVTDDPYASVYYDGETRLFKEKPTEPSAGTFPLGNMFVGIVTEIAADVTKAKVGEQVAGYGNLKEYHTMHENNLWFLNGKMTWKEGVCFDPLHYALGGFRDGNVRAGDRILISGLGAIGLMAVQLAKKAGVTFRCYVHRCFRPNIEKTGSGAKYRSRCGV